MGFVIIDRHGERKWKESSGIAAWTRDCYCGKSIHYFFYAIESLRLLLSIVAMTTLQIVYSAASATLAGCHNLLNLDLASTEMVEINRDDDEANEIELTFF